MSQDDPRPPAGADLCALDDLAEGGARGFRFRAGERQFAGFVIRFQGEVRGYVDSCPHAGWPLAAFDDRYFARGGNHLLCTGHGALFRPLDGHCVSGPCAGQALASWPVAVRDGRIVTV